MPRTTLRRLVGTRFQELFHSPPGVLFTLPSRYSCTIGHQGVFSLTRWSWQIHTGFHGPRATREHPPQSDRRYVYGALTHYGRPLACRSTTPRIYHCATGRRSCLRGPTTPMTQPPPGITRHRFRLDPLSLATTHGITCCFLFHRVLRCFTSPGSLHTPYAFRCG
jgi:hypothetical protein